MKSIKVAIFEDNNSFRGMLYHIINGSDNFECVGAFPNCNDLIEEVKKTGPDVVLMDIGMPEISGIQAVQILREEFPGLKILMQTIFDDNEKIFQSICAGASGYILKNTSPSRILQCITETYQGGAPISPSVASKVLKMLHSSPDKTKNYSFNLTEREKEILQYLVDGMSYKLIASECFLSIDTVRFHIKSIYEKLHVHSKSEAVAKAIKKNII